MNRRRMMMQQATKRIRNEIEVAKANTFIGRAKIDVGSREYFTVNDDWCIVSWISFVSYISGKTFYTPFIISCTENGAIYRITGGGKTSKTYTINYNGEIYYYSDVPFASPIFDIVSDFVYLNDITGIESYTDVRQSTQAAKDLLDYYYGKI